MERSSNFPFQLIEEALLAGNLSSALAQVSASKQLARDIEDRTPVVSLHLHLETMEWAQWLCCIDEPGVNRFWS